MVIIQFFHYLMKTIGYDKSLPMTKQKKLLLAFGIIMFDLATFFLPLAALFLAYVIVYNPPWVKDFLNRLESEAD